MANCGWICVDHTYTSSRMREPHLAERNGGFIDMYVMMFFSALGVTNQRETTLVWDKETGEPLYNAIGACIVHLNEKVSLPNMSYLY